MSELIVHITRPVLILTKQINITLLGDHNNERRDFGKVQHIRYFPIKEGRPASLFMLTDEYVVGIAEEEIPDKLRLLLEDPTNHSMSPARLIEQFM